ncbi:M23 peptidase domain-containing protein [Yersinia pseudotuberculosis]|nr:M23 peptidase domain-containing protein [Yersinia pseudotuberculosis]
MKQLIPTKALSNGQWQTIFTIEALHFGKPVQLLIYREQGSELIIQG